MSGTRIAHMRHSHPCHAGSWRWTSHFGAAQAMSKEHRAPGRGPGCNWQLEYHKIHATAPIACNTRIAQSTTQRRQLKMALGNTTTSPHRVFDSNARSAPTKRHLFYMVIDTSTSAPHACCWRYAWTAATSPSGWFFPWFPESSLAQQGPLHTLMRTPLNWWHTWQGLWGKWMVDATD